MTRSAQVGFAVIVTMLVAGAALLLWTDIWRTKTTLTIENRSAQVIKVGIGDDGIGCWDNETVPANTTTQVTLKLHGQHILCLGDGIYRLSIETASGPHDCDWDALGSDRTIVVTDSGPDCPT